MMSINIIEFNEAKVTYSLESPTLPLDSVFFPSMTICNQNAMRNSFLDDILGKIQNYSFTHVTEENRI